MKEMGKYCISVKKYLSSGLKILTEVEKDLSILQVSIIISYLHIKQVC